MTVDELVCSLALAPAELHTLTAESLDRGPIPTPSKLREHAFVLFYGGLPLLLHQLWHSFASHREVFRFVVPRVCFELTFLVCSLETLRGTIDHACVSFLLYRLPGLQLADPSSVASFVSQFPRKIPCVFGKLTIACETGHALRYGTLDEKNVSRDRIPDRSVRQLAIGIAGPSWPSKPRAFVN